MTRTSGETVSDSDLRQRQNTAAFRNLGMFLVGQGLSNIGTFSQVVALSLLVLDLGGSSLALGIAVSLQALPQLLLSPWAGPLLDRLPLHRVLLVTATQAINASRVRPINGRRAIGHRRAPASSPHTMAMNRPT